MQPQLQLGNSYSKSTTGRLKWHPFTSNLYGFCFRPKKNILVSGNAGDKKNLHPGGRNFFLTRFSGYIIFSSLVSFAFFVFLFFCCCLFVCFLKLKICIQIHIRLCGRVIFTRQISGSKTTFLALIYLMWILKKQSPQVHCEKVF